MTAANWFVAAPVRGLSLRALPPAPPNIRVLHDDDLHLTIAFLGPCGEARARAAWATLDTLPPATMISFGPVVPMGAPGAYSALSALLALGRVPMEHAIGALRDGLCDAASARLDRRPPKAHVTVARPTRRADASDRAAGLAWAAALDLGAPRVRLDTLALYTWSEDRGERLFRPVATRLLPSDEVSPSTP